MGSASSAGAPRLLLKLGAGGMGEVYVARRGSELVVVKRISSTRGAAGVLASMREEFRLASKTSHPNVCRVFSAEDTADGVSIVMEYLEGVPLWRFGGVASDLALVGGMILQAAAGLDHVHELGVVHRDVNPQNLMVTPDGAVKLLDFGIAKSSDTGLKTTTGTVKGTPAYLAPEQVKALPIDRRADVFALGATVFELLTGDPPFARDNFLATVLAITSDPIPDPAKVRPDLPPAVGAVLQRALARSRDERYPTAGAFAADLAAALGTVPLAPAEIGQRVQKRFGFELDDRRRRIQMAIDQLESGKFAAPLEDERIEDAQTTVRIARLHAAAQQATTTAKVGRRRWPAVVIGAAVLGVGAYAARGLVVTPPVVAPSPEPVEGSRDATAPLPDAPPQTPDARSPTPDARPEVPDARPVRRTKGKVVKPPVVVEGPDGFVTIGSTPHATITIDGKDYGLTPLFRKPLAPGKHKVKAVCSCGPTRTFTITVAPGAASAPIKLTW